ncbi:MAG: dTMP kinase [Gemmatales bacterium]|nr:dTMP kinase [Gemmatales bacterium]MCS7160122.1 dTMP kinase [Gemmatales bacterium]MDW8175322.1 dTMP kinase [Gemmatales bacterium]MDW8221642.1 dTMP kinase [Gemmatales bacterium]
MSQGFFLSLDGVDGAGKTTQCRLLADWLSQRGYRVVRCREPGGTAVGERLREILLHCPAVHVMTELLLFMASRAQLVTEVIRPALARGEVVVADRFLLASVVYQGYGGGLPPDRIWELGRWATGNTLPQLTLILDISPEQAQQRKPPQEDCFERRGLEFLRRVREGFLTEARRWPDTMVVVNAELAVAEVQAKLRREVERVLSGNPRS